MAQRSPARFRQIAIGMLAACLAIIAVLGVSRVLGITHILFKPAEKDRIAQDLQSLESAIRIYVARYRGLPPSRGYQEAMTQGAVVESWPKDPWGNEYRFVVTGDGTAEVASWGSDGRPGGSGDAADVVRAIDFRRRPSDSP